MITGSEDFWKTFKVTNGALSTAEAISIANIASLAPEGAYIELGTFNGKSSMSACLGLKGENAPFYLVDPIFEDKKIADQVIASINKATFTSSSLIPVADYSTNVIDKYGPYAYVFSDAGSHQGGLPMKEVIMLEDQIIPGGILCFHDYKSQFIEVHEAYDYLLSTGKYEEIPIDWTSIINYVREHNLEAGNTSWHHQELDFPCFVGAVRRI